MDAHPDVLRAIRIEGRGAPRVVRKAAYAATLVESGGRNLGYGDRDSLGAFQQRPSQGWGSASQVMNPRYAARQFIRRAKVVAAQHPEYNSAEIAQAVQRSAYPDRYGRHDIQVEAQKLSAGGGGSNSVSVRKPGSTDVSLQSRTIPGQSFAAERQAARRDLLLGGELTTEKLLAYKQTVNSLQDVPERKVHGDLKVERRRGETVRVGGGRKSDPVKGQGHIYEVFYDPNKRYWDAGSVHAGAIGGHTDHVHVSADQKFLVKLGRYAESLGLRVGENPAFGGVGGGHTQGSYHYKKDGTGAIDVSGDPRTMRKFARTVMMEARRGRGR